MFVYPLAFASIVGSHRNTLCDGQIKNKLSAHSTVICDMMFDICLPLASYIISSHDSKSKIFKQMPEEIADIDCER